jgi:hypothetical protein
MKSPFLLLAVSMITFFWVQNAWAQENKLLERDLPSRYYLGKEEQMLLPVNILGLVQKPGQYMVPYRTDLISLIAFAGGFREDAKINEIKIVRVAIANGVNGNSSRKARSRVFKVDVKKFFETGDQRQIPQLMPDDTVIVSGTAARSVNKVFDFLTKAVILGQLAFYITVALER